MNRFSTELAALRRLPVLLVTLPFFALAATSGHLVLAQGANGIQSALPALKDPKFKDQLYAAGGPTLQDQKNGKPVTKIVIEGNHSITESNILSHMQTREERVFDNDVFARDIAELYNTGFFNSVRPTFTEDEAAGTVEIKIVVAEKPTIKSVTFHGNYVYGDKKLLKYCGFQVGDPISPHTVLAARNRLEEYYKSEGFNHANVEVWKGDRPNDREIVYRISEGELERVDNVRFVGNSAFSTELLKTKIATRDSNRYLPNLTTYLLNKASLDKIDEDCIILTEYYRALGYFDARIDRVLQYDDSGKWINLTFVVFEGEPYSVRHVRVEGNRYYPTDKIQPFLEVHENSAYRQNKKMNDERFLRDAYGAVGFIFCDVVARLELEPETHLVDIVYQIEEGDTYRCSDINIHIEGDKSYTKERVAMNLLGNMRPNAIIDGQEMNAAKRRLSNSTIFENNPANGTTPRISVKPFKFGDESDADQ